ncbi:MAG: NfeD family protein [Pontiellaceae bacterium]|nr:NfeD family protein [Pontiellaceae bacterium]MBN2785427.1 NfeD family protein [Pontiellaceae bacterium]
MFSASFWWALVGVTLMICEFAVPGLILFFFGLGALLTALLTGVFDLSLTIQLVFFTVASLVFLFGLRRLLKPVFMGRTGDSAAMTETLVGETATVSVAIAPGVPGKVMLHGADWKAESEESLEVGRQVEISGQKSLTLIVKAK